MLVGRRKYHPIADIDRRKGGDVYKETNLNSVHSKIASSERCTAKTYHKLL